MFSVTIKQYLTLNEILILATEVDLRETFDFHYGYGDGFTMYIYSISTNLQYIIKPLTTWQQPVIVGDICFLGTFAQDKPTIREKIHERY